MTHLDGNALAGPLADLFGVDMTVAVARCGGCGQVDPLAHAVVFVSSMGAVVRCAHCQSVQAVLVETPQERVITLAGLSSVRIPRPAPQNVLTKPIDRVAGSNPMPV